MTLSTHPTSRSAFTFVEVMIVVVIIGILAAIVVPQFGGMTSDARASAVQSALGGVRSGIAGYRAKQIISGADPYPTATQIATTGVVIQGDVPVNPWNNSSLIQEVSSSAAASRSVDGVEKFGWNYYMDNSANPPVAVFYANSEEETNVPDGSGGFKKANEL